MHEYFKIKESVSSLLEPHGFVETVKDKQPDVMGSLFSVYCRGDDRYLLEWDGEEGYGYVERWIGASWRRLANIVPESAECDFKKSVMRLVAEMKTQIDQKPNQAERSTE